VSEPFRIDPDAPKLINVQVADHITARIRAGDLAPGARLAAERDLATQYGVSYDTIRRATALLRDRELIITIVGREPTSPRRTSGHSYCVMTIIRGLVVCK
jgi:DNA-binding FadR family transcriptional regulator